MKDKILQIVNRLYLPYIFAVGLITGPWFFRSGYLFFVDYVIGPNISLAWNNSYFIYNIIIKLFDFVLPLAFVQKAFITFILLLILLGAKMLSEQFIESKVLVFVCSLFSLLNPFVYTRAVFGQIGVLLALGYLLFLTAYLIKFIKTKDRKNILFAAIFGGLAILALPHAIFFTFILFLLLVLISLKFNISSKEKLKILVYYLIGVAIVLLINSNWLFSSLISTNSSVGAEITKSDLQIFQTTGSSPFDTFLNVVLMGGFWAEAHNRFMDLKTLSSNWGRTFYFILPIILFGLYNSIKSKKRYLKHIAIGLTSIYIGSLFLSLGIKTELTSQVTLFLFRYFPLYKMFREPQKWVLLMVICYQVFFAFGLQYLFKLKLWKRYKSVVLLIISFLLMMQAPLLIWGFRGQIKPINYPQSWYNLDRHLQVETNCDKTTVIFPWHMYMSFSWLPRIVVNPAEHFFTCPVKKGTNMEAGSIFDNSGDNEGKNIGDWAMSHGEEDLLSENIGYIVLLKELDWHSYSWLNDNKQLKLIKENSYYMLYEFEKGDN